MQTPFGFIGAGKMAEAILAGMLREKVAVPEEVLLCDRVESRLQELEGKYQVSTTTDTAMATAACRVLILAVKPQDLFALLDSIRPRLTENHLLISIVAGKSFHTIRQHIGPGARLMRVMPNLPLAVGEGMTAYTPGCTATEEDCDLVEAIFGSSGAVSEIPEAEFDAVTALSGSGPAFFAWVMQTFAQAAEAAGLPPGVSDAFALQTMLGTATYLTETEQPAADFIRAVCSPHGTTEAGMRALEGGTAAEGLRAAIAAAAARSRELAE